MAITLSAAARTAIMTALRDTVPGGTLELLSAGSAVLAIFTLSTPAGSVAGDVWTLAFTSTSTTGTAAAASGTVATTARFKNAAAAVTLSGLTVSLTAGSGDVKLDNTSISTGQTVTISSGTVTYT